MRNSLTGIAFAVVLVAALFAAAHFGSRPAVPSGADQSADPAEVVDALPKDFQGSAAVGDWTLSCGRARSLPRVPQVGNSAAAPPKEAPPPGWTLPHCNVSQGMKSLSNPDNQARMMLRRMGFKSVLAIFLRFPSDAVSAGDPATLKLDKTSVSIPIRTCAPSFCLAVMSIRKADEPQFLKTKRISILFTSRKSNKPVAVPFRMRGFEQAVGAMRRMDK
jgi:invasion protein IalB